MHVMYFTDYKLDGYSAVLYLVKLDSMVGCTCMQSFPYKA